MARHPPRKVKGKSASRLSDSAEKFGSSQVDEHFHTRDKVSLHDDRGSDDEDYLTGQTEEVFGLNLEQEKDDGEDEEEEEYDQAPAVKKGRKVKVVKDDSHRGRFGKAEVDSDDEEESEEDSEDDPDAEGWGRSYYSRPSTRREKDTGTTEDEERRDEERKLELLEAKRLQKKARMAMRSEDDWGLDALKAEKQVEETPSMVKESMATTSLPAPPSTAPPATLTTHLALSDPVKLALLREFPLVVDRLKKTERGVERMRREAETGDGQLNQAFGWLHYQTLLTYATTLAFYIHLAALPASSRPDFTTHPILPRLLQLKQNLVMLESNDLDTASVDEDDTIELYDRDAMTEDDDEEDEDDELADGKRELLSKLMGSDVLGSGGVLDWKDDAEDLWEAGSLEDDELEELKRDAAGAWDDEDDEDGSEGSDDDDEDEEDEESGSDSELSFDDDALLAMAANLRSEGPSGKSTTAKPAAKSITKSNTKSTATPYTLLEEPAFVPSKATSRSKSSTAVLDDHGDPTHLTSADATDKAAKKHSLRFHTSKIAATSARRAAARQDRMGGDDDIPYRDRKAARDAALRKSGGNQEDGEDLDGSEWTEKDRKRAREVMEDDGGEEEAAEGDDGYYDLVKRRKTEEKNSKKEHYDAGVAARKAELESIDEHSGPRSLTRAIEKNKGLTPHRSKAVRNPRVKKRERYEKAKRKVSSQRAVYKGGQGALEGSYSGEKSGISMVSKSRRF